MQARVVGRETFSLCRHKQTTISRQKSCKRQTGGLQFVVGDQRGGELRGVTRSQDMTFEQQACAVYDIP